MNDENIQQGLERDSQIITERIPMDMTRQKARKVAESLQTFLKDHNWSQTKAAEAIGVSPAQINQFLADKYKGNLSDLINKVVNLINSVSRRETRVKKKPFVDTSIAIKIRTLINQTESFTDKTEGGKIGLIIGDSGHGKSCCLKQFAEANKNTIFVEFDDGMTSTMLFSDIARELKIDSSGSLSGITRRLINNLQNRQCIIMIDEASSLTVKQLNQLRQIIVVKSRCPLVLAGNRHLLYTVMQPTTRRGYESLDQFTSRLMAVLDLDARASNKEGGLYTADDIRQLYEYGGIRLTGDAVKTLQKICKTSRSGRMQTCGVIIIALHMSSLVIREGVIDAQIILQAIKELALPVKDWLPLAIEEEIEETEQAQIIKVG
jgi:DNA transposition AAA+ family ATPase